MSTPLPPIDEWWDLADRASTNASLKPPGDPEWLRLLAVASSAELAFQIDAARKALQEAAPSVPEGEWKRAHRLLELRTDMRAADGPALEPLLKKVVEWVGAIPVDGTSARAWHLAGSLQIRTNAFSDAEDSLHRALVALRGTSPTRASWITDGFGTALLGNGAWEESRMVLERASERKGAAGDGLGAAISLGNLALLELTLGSGPAGHAAARRALDRLPANAPALSRLRLATFSLQSLLQRPPFDAAAIATEAASVESLLAATGADPHPLKGFAAIALARAESTAQRPSRADAWLTVADGHFTMAENRVLLGFWRERLFPGGADLTKVLGEMRWFGEMEALFRKTGAVTEAEILVRLLVAERAAEGGRRDAVHAHLHAASERARGSNNQLLVELVDRAYERLEPEALSELLVERFAGRTSSELTSTAQEEVTMIFADLVGFTERSQHLLPAAVMQTSRSFFELAVPLLAERRVRPVSCMGDGLLAIAQGPGHRERGLSFARRLVRRAGRLSAVRKVLEIPFGLDLRAGVASGPVVMGLLGSHFKREFAAIGLTTNLAARLQSAAKPGEVVASRDTAGALASEGTPEEIQAKGFDAPIPIVRFRESD